LYKEMAEEISQGVFIRVFLAEEKGCDVRAPRAYCNAGFRASRDFYKLGECGGQHGGATDVVQIEEADDGFFDKIVRATGAGSHPDHYG
jgi:hypothetical protein